MVTRPVHLPPCLEALLTEKFFNSCLIHQESKKNDVNLFCLDCCRGICSHCLPLHPSHRLLQIRRYVYHEVIRLGDAHKLVDCALVQSYSTNNAKVVFLNHRPQANPARLSRLSGNVCITCHRPLQNPFLFCSVSCKLRHAPTTTNVYVTSPDINRLHDHGHKTPLSVLETPTPTTTNSSVSSAATGFIGSQAAAACTAASSDVVRKKRSSVAVFRADCREIVSRLASEIPLRNRRRKVTPRRAPFY